MTTNAPHRSPLGSYRGPAAAAVAASVALVVAMLVPGTALSVSLVAKFPAALLSLAMIGPDEQALSAPAAELVVGATFLLFLAAQAWLVSRLVRGLRVQRSWRTLTSDSR